MVFYTPDKVDGKLSSLFCATQRIYTKHEVYHSGKAHRETQGMSRSRRCWAAAFRPDLRESLRQLSCT